MKCIYNVHSCASGTVAAPLFLHLYSICQEMLEVIKTTLEPRPERPNHDAPEGETEEGMVEPEEEEYEITTDAK